MAVMAPMSSDLQSLSAALCRCSVISRQANRLPFAHHMDSHFKFLVPRPPQWETERIEADFALPKPPDLENESPICRWKSEDYVPPPKE